MENYILKLNSGTEYKLYKGATLVSDADLTTLFGVAGEMYLSFDFNSATPSDLTTFTITDSSNVAVISNSNVTVAEGKNYKATWSNGATTFDTFEELEGKALDESQLSFLMEKTKEAGGVKDVYLEYNGTFNIPMTDFMAAAGVSYPFSGAFFVTLGSSFGTNLVSLDGTAVAYTTSSANSRQFTLYIYAKNSSDIEWFFVPRNYAPGNINPQVQIQYRQKGRRTYNVLTTGSIVDNLLGGAFYERFPLSAAQGKVLKDLIDSYHPVGEVMTTTSATAPTISGQTWTLLGSQAIGSSTVYYYERTA